MEIFEFSTPPIRTVNEGKSNAWKTAAVVHCEMPEQNERKEYDAIVSIVPDYTGVFTKVKY